MESVVLSDPTSFVSLKIVDLASFERPDFPFLPGSCIRHFD